MAKIRIALLKHEWLDIARRRDWVIELLTRSFVTEKMPRK